MLNLRSPGAEHIFHASGLIGRVMGYGQIMSVSPSAVRAELLDECLPLFEQMRDLARAHFASCLSFILPAIDEYEAAIWNLAWLGGGQITEDRRDGEGNCPACGTAITKFCSDPGEKAPDRRWIILCGKCDEPFMAAYHKLDSSEGFGTWGI